MTGFVAHVFVGQSTAFCSVSAAEVVLVDEQDRTIVRNRGEVRQLHSWETIYETEAAALAAGIEGLRAAAERAVSEADRLADGLDSMKPEVIA